MISLKPYSDEYKSGVLSVLKRNFKLFRRLFKHKNDEDFYKWLSPIFAYKWQDDVSDIPFNHGAVLLDDDLVVGYFGAIYSRRIINGEKYLCVNFSTWAIDNKYRAYFLKANKELCAYGDIFLDFTPNLPSREAEEKLFKFKLINDKYFSVFPVPSFSRKLNVKFIEDPEELSDPEQKKIFLDHKPYGVKCVVFERENERGCMFYSSRMGRYKRYIPCHRVRALKIFNEKFFTQNFREIVYRVQKHESPIAIFLIDENFLDGSIKHPLFFTVRTYRYMLAKKDVNYKPDFLYSELATFI